MDDVGENGFKTDAPLRWERCDLLDELIGVCLWRPDWCMWGTEWFYNLNILTYLLFLCATVYKIFQEVLYIDQWQALAVQPKISLTCTRKRSWWMETNWVKQKRSWKRYNFGSARHCGQVRNRISSQTLTSGSMAVRLTGGRDVREVMPGRYGRTSGSWSPVSNR